jgi:hypothetical protein
MSKVSPTTKEQLVYFLITNISLGTYDRRFLINIENLNLSASKPLTSNQASLLDKIVQRYQRQLEKHSLALGTMLNLPWKQQPVASLPMYTETHLMLVDDELILRSPYNNAFIKDFKKLFTASKWSSEDRFWRIPANSFTLKRVVESIEKHFDTVNYCEQLTAMFLATTPLENCKYWTPTFKFVNGNFYVMGTNEPLQAAIAHIPYEVELEILSRLVSHGITIDTSVIDRFKENFTEHSVLFAASFNTSVEEDDDNFIPNLVSLKPDLVVFDEYTTSPRAYFNSIKKGLNEYGVEYAELTFHTQLNSTTTGGNFTILVGSGINFNFSKDLIPIPSINKFVKVVNSKPVNIK